MYVIYVIKSQYRILYFKKWEYKKIIVKTNGLPILEKKKNVPF